MVALSSVSMGGNRKVSKRIMTDSTERSIKININAAIQTDRIPMEAIIIILNLNTPKVTIYKRRIILDLLMNSYDLRTIFALLFLSADVHLLQASGDP